MARYKNDVARYISDNLNIVDVIGTSVNLKRAGRNYTGLCPFHSEKTPSFSVSPDKQMFHCFGCKESGDAISFVMKYENLAFIDAIETLAERYNIDLAPYVVEYDNSGVDTKVLYEIMRNSGLYFYNTLMNNEQAYEYLKKRGLNDSVIKRFGLGFADDSWDGLIVHLTKMGFLQKDMLECGMISQKDSHSYVRFRNRIMFPIFDRRGRVIAFGGRIIDNTNPKYLNSPETVIFNKSKTLYGFNLAIKTAKEVNSLVLVEGYMDVISLNQAGITNVSATLGTALNIEHIKLIKQYYSEVVFSFDGDSAGRTAIFKSLPLFDGSGLKLKILDMGNFKDPDELVKKIGKHGFEKQIQDAMSEIDFKIKYYMQGYNLSDNHDRLAFLEKVYGLIRGLKYETQREVYFERLSALLNLSQSAIKNDYDIKAREVGKKEYHNIKNNKISENKIEQENIFDNYDGDIPFENMDYLEYLDFVNDVSEFDLDYSINDSVSAQEHNPLISKLEKYIFKYCIDNKENIEIVEKNQKFQFTNFSFKEEYEKLKTYYSVYSEYSLEKMLENNELSDVSRIEGIRETKIPLEFGNSVSQLIIKHQILVLEETLSKLDKEISSLEMMLDDESKLQYRQKLSQRPSLSKEINDLKMQRLKIT